MRAAIGVVLLALAGAMPLRAQAFVELGIDALEFYQKNLQFAPENLRDRYREELMVAAEMIGVKSLSASYESCWLKIGFVACAEYAIRIV